MYTTVLVCILRTWAQSQEAISVISIYNNFSLQALIFLPEVKNTNSPGQYKELSTVRQFTHIHLCKKKLTDDLTHDGHRGAHERHCAVRHIELLAHRLQEHRLRAEHPNWQHEHQRCHCMKKSCRTVGSEPQFYCRTFCNTIIDMFSYSYIVTHSYSYYQFNYKYLYILVHQKLLTQNVIHLNFSVLKIFRFLILNF